MGRKPYKRTDLTEEEKRELRQKRSMMVIASWGTEREKRYIRMMGKGLWRRTEFTRLELLERYKECMAIRKNWGHIDKNEILFFVEEEIRKERERY